MNIVYWAYMVIMEKKMETTKYVGVYTDNGRVDDLGSRVSWILQVVCDSPSVCR